MASTLVKIDTRTIKDWASFHDVFANELGFPDFYGRNMDAWNDCMGSLDDPDDCMTTVHAPVGGVLTLQLDHVAEFAKRCPEIYDALIEGTAFVNYSRIDMGREPVLALSFFMREPRT